MAATFTLRVDPSVHQDLLDLARIKDRSAADLAREFIEEGVRRSIDPDAIERLMEQERDRLLARAQEIRQGRGSSMEASV